MKKLSLSLLLASAFLVSAETPLTNGRLVGTFKTQPTITISGSNIDWSSSQKFQKTLSANITFTFSNATDTRAPIVVKITNTASNYVVTWPTVKWTGNVAPVQTIGVKMDVYTFVVIGSDICGSVIQNFTP